MKYIQIKNKNEENKEKIGHQIRLKLLCEVSIVLDSEIHGSSVAKKEEKEAKKFADTKTNFTVTWESTVSLTRSRAYL